MCLAHFVGVACNQVACVVQGQGGEMKSSGLGHFRLNQSEQT